MLKKAVILVAGMGTRLRSVTKNEIPKPFLKIKNKTLIERSVEKLLDSGIKELILVTGHLDHFFEELKNKYPQITTIKNQNFSQTGSMQSLFCAKDLIANDDILLLEGDLIYEKAALDILINEPKKDAILLSENKNMTDDYYVDLGRDFNIHLLTPDLSKITGNFGEWTGIQKLSNSTLNKLFSLYETLENKKISYENTLELLAKEHFINCKKIDGILWSEIDDEIQLKNVLANLYEKIIQKEGNKYE